MSKTEKKAPWTDFPKSSNVQRARYIPGKAQDGTIEVEFTGGATYRYLETPEALFDAMVDSGSVGRFLIENIKGVFKFEKVEKKKEV
jgi:hypothetical protein